MGMLKPGSYAVIVKDPHCDNADVGRVVHVVMRNDDASPDADTEWLCKPVTSRPLKHSSGTVDRGMVAIPAEFLHPCPASLAELLLQGEPEEVDMPWL